MIAQPKRNIAAYDLNLDVARGHEKTDNFRQKIAFILQER